MILGSGSAYLAFLLASFNTPAVSANLNVTAIGYHNNQSHFECWQLCSPFISSDQNGLVGAATMSLGDVVNMTYNVVPPGFDSGFHTTPTNQWLIVLQGLGVVTMPDNRSITFTAAGGQAALIFATDTAAVSKLGHGGVSPGISETVLLQLPTMNGSVPEHKILYHDKPCGAIEYMET
ncbi:hypothetical protein F5Y16DRAFT_392909 [Xylariaceae sp. FL0255]|nr:hypothetical protein F5Y16DRAFT_392909 [Xylariaceae sp. FL0255]